jgi:hypothetical protein
VSTVSPARTSSPARRTCCPAGAGRVIATWATPPSVCSTGTTASAPAGSIAPVMIRTQTPGMTRSGEAGPAATSPVTGRSTGASCEAPATSSARTA